MTKLRSQQAHKNLRILSQEIEEERQKAISIQEKFHDLQIEYKSTIQKKVCEPTSTQLHSYNCIHYTNSNKFIFILIFFGKLELYEQLKEQQEVFQALKRRCSRKRRFMQAFTISGESTDHHADFNDNQAHELISH